MLFRHIADHVRAQNWTAIAIDFVIVVIGVFMGLQTQEWSREHEDRKRELQIVGDLLADLEIDRMQYANGINAAARRIGAANASLVGAGLPALQFDFDAPHKDFARYSLDLSKSPEIPASERNRLWTGVTIAYFPTLSTSTYDAMVGSGDIKIISDRDLVRAIQVYNNVSNGVDMQNDKLLPIRENLLEAGAAHGLAPYVDIPVEDYFRLISTEPQLAALIRIQATFAIFHQGEMASADTYAAELQERLSAYLEAAK